MENTSPISIQEIQSFESQLPPTPDEINLLTREVAHKSKIESFSNDVSLVKLRDDGSGIFKPSNGEKDTRPKIEEGTCYKRERAAFLVDKILDFNLVPATVIREISQDVGSLQKFIEDYQWFGQCSTEYSVLSAQTYNLFLLDYIIWNSDRHQFNLIVKDDRIHAIDNGFAFSKDDLRIFDGHQATTNLNSYFGKEAPKDTIEKIRSFSQDTNRRKILEDSLKDLIKPEELEACIHRIDHLANVFKKGKKITANTDMSYNPK